MPVTSLPVSTMLTFCKQCSANVRAYVCSLCCYAVLCAMLFRTVLRYEVRRQFTHAHVVCCCRCYVAVHKKIVREKFEIFFDEYLSFLGDFFKIRYEFLILYIFSWQSKKTVSKIHVNFPVHRYCSAQMQNTNGFSVIFLVWVWTLDYLFGIRSLCLCVWVCSNGNFAFPIKKCQCAVLYTKTSCVRRIELKWHWVEVEVKASQSKTQKCNNKQFI